MERAAGRKRGTAGTDSGIVILCFTQEMLVLVITASTHTFGQLRQNKHSNTQSHKPCEPDVARKLPAR